MADIAFTYDPGPFVKGLGFVFPEITKLKKTWDAFVGTVNKGTSSAARHTKQIADTMKQSFGSSGGTGPFKFKDRETEDLYQQFFGGIFGQKVKSPRIKDDPEATMKGTANMGKMTAAIGKFAIAAGVAVAVIGAIYLGIKKTWEFMKTGIPELQQVFGTVKDIFMRNFFYPIRQFLLPYLQKILDWARDHRAAFVQWGSVAVNVLKTVFRVAGFLFNVFKAIGGALAAVFRWIGNLHTGSLANDVNLFLAKVYIAGAFLVNTFTHLGMIVRGFMENASDWVKTVAGNIAQWVSDRWADLGNTLKDTFRVVAGFVQNQITGALNVVKGVIDDIKGLVDAIVKFFSQGIPGWIGETAKNISGAVSSAAQAGGQAAGVAWDWLKKLNDFLGRPVLTIHDAIIQNGRVIRPDVNDTIIATKNPAAIGGGNMTMTVYLNVTEGNARRAGEEFTAGMGSGFRRMLLDRMQNGGRN